jgi:hypothetical protein
MATKDVLSKSPGTVLWRMERNLWGKRHVLAEN